MRPERDSRPEANRAARESHESDNDSLEPSTLDPFSRAVLVDVFLTGERRFWLKREADFLAARPTPGEYVGNATREQLSARWRRLTEVAQACGARADVVGVNEELEHLLGEVA